MIIPSIDLMGGQTVQLVGGEDKALDAGDPRPLAERFSVAGEIAVIDLDAALGQGDNQELIESLLPLAQCRVGGGIRDVETAVRWLDAGAAKVILGTAAQPEILSQLPRDRVIVALDARDGEVVVEGWKTGTGKGIVERMRQLRDLAGGFLVTFVEREGRLAGTALEQVARLVGEAGSARLTVAGGVSTCQEIAKLDSLGADAQVGMAIYTGRMDLGQAVAAPLVSDRPDGLWPTVVVDEHGQALGLVYSDSQSVAQAVKTRRGVYHSRSRGLWPKGDSSGDTQDLMRIDLDCDRDALRFTVKQHGRGFCHLGSRSCWGQSHGLPALARTIIQRVTEAPAGSYTRRLLDEPHLLQAKLLEEARELAEAKGPGHVAWETADLFYFALVAMARGGVDLTEVEAELHRRSLKVTRRPGEAKAPEGEG